MIGHTPYRISPRKGTPTAAERSFASAGALLPALSFGTEESLLKKHAIAR